MWRPAKRDDGGEGDKETKGKRKDRRTDWQGELWRVIQRILTHFIKARSDKAAKQKLPWPGDHRHIKIDCSSTQPTGVVYSNSYVIHHYKMHFGAAYGGSILIGLACTTMACSTQQLPPSQQLPMSNLFLWDVYACNRQLLQKIGNFSNFLLQCTVPLGICSWEELVWMGLKGNYHCMVALLFD